jgi:hypothetical protein
MATALTNAAWIAICKAAKLLPDPETRAELSACLFAEYPAFAYDRKRVAATLKRSMAALEHCKALAKLYQQVPARPDDIMRERDFFYIERLHRRALAHVLACRAIRRANAGRRDPQREWLISRLCGVWLDNFGAPDLTVTVPPLGGAPRGPLIEFLLAAMRPIMPRRELPSRASLPRMIMREREERENAKQLRLELRERIMGF